MFSRVSIQVKITALLSALLVVAVALNVLWSASSQISQAERELLEKTQVLNQELRAVWEFIDINQKRIDTDADGNFNFKNIYCAIAGKSVAAIFMRDTNYEVRYVSLTPRKINSRPNSFERASLETFASRISSEQANEQISEQANGDVGVNAKEGTGGAAKTVVSQGAEDEIYGLAELDGQQVFRYISPIYIESSCLSCHGEPAGELDITGFPKEGFTVGSLAGAVSITVPVDNYLQGIWNNITQQSVYFAVVLALLVTIACLAIALLVRRLEKANTRLTQESRYKSDFLAIMSHELRTPLTSIMAFTELWEREERMLGEEERREVAEVKESGFILLEMVNNILEAARAEAGKTRLQCEWVDLVDLFSTIEGTVRPLAERKELALYTQVAPEVPLIYADWEKLRRIIENLASNAIKFTQPGGVVHIAATLGRLDSAGNREGAGNRKSANGLDSTGNRKGAGNRESAEEKNAPATSAPATNAAAINASAINASATTYAVGCLPQEPHVCITVSDTGIGIKQENQERMFDRFTQLDQSAQRRYRGSGLGLAVVRELTDAHGGQVEVYSVHKQGSTFTVRIPLGKPPNALLYREGEDA